jgi:isopentenyl-diphosphate delta-isomerase
MSDELLDIINEKDEVIDLQPRGVVHQLGLWHRGAHVFLFTSDGKMLVQKRSADRTAEPSKLDCSVSEHVKAGETYLEAARRGMKEELGVEVFALKELVKFRMNYGLNDNEVSVLFEGSVNPADVQFDPVEIASVQYLSMDELQTMAKNESEKLCGWFVQLLRWRAGNPSKMSLDV